MAPSGNTDDVVAGLDESVRFAEGDGELDSFVQILSPFGQAVLLEWIEVTTFSSFRDQVLPDRSNFPNQVCRSSKVFCQSITPFL